MTTQGGRRGWEGMGGRLCKGVDQRAREGSRAEQQRLGWVHGAPSALTLQPLDQPAGCRAWKPWVLARPAQGRVDPSPSSVSWPTARHPPVCPGPRLRSALQQPQEDWGRGQTPGGRQSQQVSTAQPEAQWLLGFLC